MGWFKDLFHDSARSSRISATVIADNRELIVAVAGDGQISTADKTALKTKLNTMLELTRSEHNDIFEHAEREAERARLVHAMVNHTWTGGLRDPNDPVAIRATSKLPANVLARRILSSAEVDGRLRAKPLVPQLFILFSAPRRANSVLKEILRDLSSSQPQLASTVAVELLQTFKLEVLASDFSPENLELLGNLALQYEDDAEAGRYMKARADQAYAEQRKNLLAGNCFTQYPGHPICSAE